MRSTLGWQCLARSPMQAPFQECERLVRMPPTSEVNLPRNMVNKPKSQNRFSPRASIPHKLSGKSTPHALCKRTSSYQNHKRQPLSPPAAPHPCARKRRARQIKNLLSGGCLSEATQSHSEFCRTAACKARIFFSRFLLARQKKPGRRRSTTGSGQ